jgi:hypothetical protein
MIINSPVFALELPMTLRFGVSWFYPGLRWSLSCWLQWTVRKYTLCLKPGFSNMPPAKSVYATRVALKIKKSIIYWKVGIFMMEMVKNELWKLFQWRKTIVFDKICDLQSLRPTEHFFMLMWPLSGFEFETHVLNKPSTWRLTNCVQYGLVNRIRIRRNHLNLGSH